MTPQVSIHQLDFQKIFFDHFPERYTPIIEDDDTVADVIFRFLFSDNSVVSLKNKSEIESEILNYYKDSIQLHISKGKPINIFLTTFMPKINKEYLTNGYIGPDLTDLLVFIHLQTISKTIREIYPYNFRFVILYKGDVYKALGKWEENTLQQHFKTLQKFNALAESITNSKNSVQLIRLDELFSTHREEFYEKWNTKTTFYERFYREQKSPYREQMDKWITDFNSLLKEDPDELIHSAAKIRAFNNLLFREGQFLDNFKANNPHLLIAHTRKRSKYFSLNLNPSGKGQLPFFLSTLDSNVLTAQKWDDIADEYHPVFLKELPNEPLFFSKKK